MSNYDLNSLFHPKVEMGAEKTSTKIGEYNPSADKGQNGVYKSVIRFVTWWQDPEHSYLSKWACWLVDPVTTRGRMIDCPSTIGKPSILQDMYWKLKKSDSIQEQRKADIFSRRQVYTAVIQVIKDDQNKEAEGKLFIWRFGKKIFDKYEAEKKPVIGEPHEPFDLLDGKAFALVITKVAGYNNYDQSRFLDKKVPLLIPDETGKLVPINERTPGETVFNFLKENSPELSKYAYKDWDSETHDYVNQIIVAVTGKTSSSGFADVRNNVNTLKPTGESTTQVPASGITSIELSLDDLQINNAGSSLPDLDLPDLNLDSNSGLGGDLGDALANL